MSQAPPVGSEARPQSTAGWGVQESLKVIGDVTIQQQAYDLLFDYVPIFYLLSRYSELFVKSRRVLPTPPAFGILVEVDHLRISPRCLAPEN